MFYNFIINVESYIFLNKELKMINTEVRCTLTVLCRTVLDFEVLLGFFFEKKVLVDVGICSGVPLPN